MNPDELITRREVVSTLFNGEYIQKDDAVSLMKEYAKQKCIEQKEIDISIAKKTGLVSAIRNAPLATDK